MTNATAERHFKEGDSVMIAEDDIYSRVGQIGTVMDFNAGHELDRAEEHRNYTVLFHDGSTGFYSREQLHVPFPTRLRTTFHGLDLRIGQDPGGFRWYVSCEDEPALHPPQESETEAKDFLHALVHQRAGSIVCTCKPGELPVWKDA